METTKKRTREEVRAAFKAFMREKEEERKAAEIRLEMYHYTYSYLCTRNHIINIKSTVLWTNYRTSKISSTLSAGSV